jgi:hypothetical protein
MNIGEFIYKSRLLRRGLYFIIEELPNPRDSGLFKILYGSTQVALDAVTPDETG